MRTTLCTALSIAMLASTTSGCAQPPEDGAEAGFRSWEPTQDFWNYNPQLPANSDLAIHSGTDVSVEDCIIWDLTGSDVHEGSAASGAPVLLQAVDNELLDPQGVLECVANEEDGLYKLRDVLTGDVIATSWGRYIFDVDIVQMPPVGSPEYAALRRDHLAVELVDDQAFAALAWKNELLGTATADLYNANPMRKLVFGALLMGECGSNGPW